MIPATHFWSMRNPTIQWLISIALLLGLVSMVLCPNEALSQSFPDNAASDGVTHVSNDAGKIQHGFLKKFFQIAEDVLEEVEEKKDADSWFPAHLLLHTSLATLQSHCASILHQAHDCQVHFNDWHSAKRLSILATQSSTLLLRIHSLKLDC
jgi:hypothetical protein